MKPECVQTLKAAAGRELTKAELDGIEMRVHGALKELAAKDPDKFRAMTLSERMSTAASMARERMIQDVVAAQERAVIDAGRKAKLFSDLESVKPGQKGRVQYLKNRLVGMENRANAIATEFLRRIETANIGKVFGVLRDPDKVRDVVGALFGEPSSPEAAATVKSIKRANDALVAFYKAEGMPLHELDNWNLPQPQDVGKVTAAGKAAWVRDHMEAVDQRAYVNPDGSIKTPDQMQEFLGHVYDTLATDGASKRAAGNGLAGGHLAGANKNAPRQLHFKDADSYLRIMETYGRTTNPYELFISHIKGMSRDLAFAEAFGRDGETNFRQALDRAFAADVGAGALKLEGLRSDTQRIFDALVHPTRPKNAAWANVAVQARGVMSSAMLGNIVPSLLDLPLVHMAAWFNGMPSLRTFRNYVDMTIPSAEKATFLRRAGLVMEGIQHEAMRMAGDEFAPGVGTWLNEKTHALAGMRALDRGSKGGFGLGVMDILGEFTRKHDTIAAAEGESRFLARYGVNDDHWAVWRAAELDDFRGSHTVLTPDAVQEVPDSALDAIILRRNPERTTKVTARERDTLRTEAAVKLLEVTNGETWFGARGASGANVADRVAMGLDRTVPGTLVGELHRFAMQFKSVPIGVLRAHWARSAELGPAGKGNTWGSTWGYRARFLAYTTLMGAIGLEIKSMMNGQDPRSADMSTPEGRKFWLESIAAGGGFGMYGDLFLNGQTGGGSGVETLMGPGISAAWGLRKEALRAGEELNAGETKHPYALSMLRWTRRNAMPFANVWYVRAAFNRLIYDQMQDTLAPGSSMKQQRRMEKRGVRYWWAPGTSAPQRAPELPQ